MKSKWPIYFVYIDIDDAEPYHVTCVDDAEPDHVTCVDDAEPDHVTCVHIEADENQNISEEDKNVVGSVNVVMSRKKSIFFKILKDKSEENNTSINTGSAYS